MALFSKKPKKNRFFFVLFQTFVKAKILKQDFSNSSQFGLIFLYLACNLKNQLHLNPYWCKSRDWLHIWLACSFFKNKRISTFKSEKKDQSENTISLTDLTKKKNFFLQVNR